VADARVDQQVRQVSSTPFDRQEPEGIVALAGEVVQLPSAFGLAAEQVGEFVLPEAHEVPDGADAALDQLAGLFPIDALQLLDRLR
jgi:hypothetical protein